jgi:hypothetical protein
MEKGFNRRTVPKGPRKTVGRLYGKMLILIQNNEAAKVWQVIFSMD